MGVPLGIFACEIYHKRVFEATGSRQDARVFDYRGNYGYRTEAT
jgi:hypothetical protein